MITNGTPYGQLVAAALLASNGVYSAGFVGFNGVTATPASSVYTLTLSNPIDAANACVFCLTTSGATSVAVTQTDDTTLVVSTFNAAGAAADAAFYIHVVRKAVL